MTDATGARLAAFAVAAAMVAQFVPGPGPFVACVILLLLSLTVAVVLAWRAAGSAPS